MAAFSIPLLMLDSAVYIIWLKFFYSHRTFLHWAKEEPATKKLVFPAQLLSTIPHSQSILIWCCTYNKLCYHKNVPTAPASKAGDTQRSPKLILKICWDEPSLTTISTFFPSGRLKATLYKLPVLVLPILTEPGGTNLDAWATM